MNKEFTELASVCDNIANSDTIEENTEVRDMDTYKLMDVEDNTETESEEIAEDSSEDESDPEYQPKETLKEKPNTTAEDSSEDNQILQSRDWKLLWSSSPYPKKPGRGSVKNNLKLKPGPTTYASCHAKNIKSCFQLFMPNSIENIIMHMTNMEGKRLYQDSWTKLDRTELQAFIGVTILSGVYRSKNESIESLWDDRTGRTIFQTIMTLGRFKSLSGIIRFDDHETTCARLQKDKLAPIRDVWDRWVDLLPRMYNPGLEVRLCVERAAGHRQSCRWKSEKESRHASCA
nr:uncharacterized protein LOC129441823 isoform X2 [Misgurnus anguillicaudatus]